MGRAGGEARGEREERGLLPPRRGARAPCTRAHRKSARAERTGFGFDSERSVIEGGHGATNPKPAKKNPTRNPTRARRAAPRRDHQIPPRDAQPSNPCCTSHLVASCAHQCGVPSIAHSPLRRVAHQIDFDIRLGGEDVRCAVRSAERVLDGRMQTGRFETPRACLPSFPDEIPSLPSLAASSGPRSDQIRSDRIRPTPFVRGRRPPIAQCM